MGITRVNSKSKTLVGSVILFLVASGARDCPGGDSDSRESEDVVEKIDPGMDAGEQGLICPKFYELTSSLPSFVGQVHLFDGNIVRDCVGMLVRNPSSDSNAEGSRVVVTSAHCVKDHDKFSIYQVLFGNRPYEVSRTIGQDGYNEGSSSSQRIRDDLAVLVLSNSVEGVVPVAITKKDYTLDVCSGDCDFNMIAIGISSSDGCAGKVDRISYLSACAEQAEGFSGYKASVRNIENGQPRPGYCFGMSSQESSKGAGGGLFGVDKTTRELVLVGILSYETPGECISSRGQFIWASSILHHYDRIEGAFGNE